MKNQRLLIIITILNILLLALSVGQTPAVVADRVAPVLRGRALEIVNDKGRVRASITVLAGDPHFKMPDGTIRYPESVLLRLISPQGRPNIKLRSRSPRPRGSISAVIARRSHAVPSSDFNRVIARPEGE